MPDEVAISAPGLCSAAQGIKGSAPLVYKHWEKHHKACGYLDFDYSRSKPGEQQSLPINQAIMISLIIHMLNRSRKNEYVY